MNRNEPYTKEIKISFDTDKSSFQKIKNAIDSLGEDFKIEGLDKTQLSSVKNLFKSIKDLKIDMNVDRFSNNVSEQLRQAKEYNDQILALEHRIAKLRELNTQEARDEIDKLVAQVEKLRSEQFEKGLAKKEETEVKSEKKKNEKLKEVGDYFVGKLKSWGDKALDYFKQIITDAWSELGDMLSYSQLTDSSIREQAFTYGFSSAQNWAFSKTKQFLGIQNDEDLYYMNAQQYKKFQEKFSEYSDKYAKLYDEGFFEKLQEYNWEMAEFEDDLKMSVVEFFVENKDTIMTAFQVIMDGTKTIVLVLSKILSAMGVSPERTTAERQAAINEKLGLSGAIVTNNTNVSIDNSFTNIAREDQTWLANAGEMTYEQIIRVLQPSRR